MNYTCWLRASKPKYIYLLHVYLYAVFMAVFENTQLQIYANKNRLVKKFVKPYNVSQCKMFIYIQHTQHLYVTKNVIVKIKHNSIFTISLPVASLNTESKTRY